MTSRMGFTFIEVLVTLTILSIGSLSVMQYISETQDLAADITHVDRLARLAQMQMQEIEKEGYSSSYSGEGEFSDFPDYTWEAHTSLLHDGGWYRMVLTVTRIDTKRSITLERVFRELL